MKIKPYQPLLALLFVSGLLQAQTTIPAGGPGNPATLTAPLTVEGDTTIEGTLTVKLPDAPPVSVGTPPVASLPIGNDKNTGFTDPATMGTSPDPDLSGNAIYTYSTNGSGEQSQVIQSNGGAEITTSGNATLSETATQTDTASYTIETREIKISNPAGYTDVAGTYGAANTFYANGETLP